MTDSNWCEGLLVAVTVTTADGTIVEMNACSRQTFAADGGAALIGRSVFDCHPEPARSKTRELYARQALNHYPIREDGQKKIIRDAVAPSVPTRDREAATSRGAGAR